MRKFMAVVLPAFFAMPTIDKVLYLVDKSYNKPILKISFYHTCRGDQRPPPIR
jgi:hypothetical protein